MTTVTRTTWIPTIGLEMHVQLNQKRKMFAPEAVSYGEAPNTFTSPTSLAHPGTLPYPNEGAILSALKIGIACDAHITRHNLFARKNYYYPDLPKGFQITQADNPICQGGFLTIYSTSGEEKIALERIHIEEDTGKSIHPTNSPVSLIDYNRAGIPLIEVVTKPVLNSPAAVERCLLAVRRLVRYLDISDGRMEEGSLRCDINISLRHPNSQTLGKKVEIKNLNSARHASLAASYEIKRQSALLNHGQAIISETRSYDPIANKTIHQRKKEGKIDYRYFEEPNISPIYINDECLKKVKKTIPVLPHELYKRLITHYQVPPADALTISENKSLAQFFQTACQTSQHYKVIANLMIGPLKYHLNETKTTIQQLNLTPSKIAQLANMVNDNVVSFSVASNQLFPELLEDQSLDPYALAKNKGFVQVNDQTQLLQWVKEAINQHPDKVNTYKQGKKGLLGFFMGEVMRLSGNQANPKSTSTILKDQLEQS